MYVYIYLCMYVRWLAFEEARAAVREARISTFGAPHHVLFYFKGALYAILRVGRDIIS